MDGADAAAGAEGASSIRLQSLQKQVHTSDAALPPAEVLGENTGSGASGQQLGTSNATPPAQLLATQNSPALSPKTEASQANQPSPARVEAIAEPSAAQRSSSRDIMVRIPDATDRGTNVRFVERGTEVHVSVRTGDVELAQMLRGGLSELTGDLQRSGIRAEVWRPGSDPSQGDSQNDSRDSAGRQNQSGAKREGQDQPNENKPRWVEELESSVTKPGAQA